MLRCLALCGLLTACVDDSESLDDTEQAVALACPGITTSGATNYRGLSGTYLRLGLPAVGEPYRLTFVPEPDAPEVFGTHGTYSGTRMMPSGVPAPYAGRFQAVPDNPAIGAALLLDVTGDGEFDQTYFVLGLQQSLGRVRSLCLIGGDQPFLLKRALY